ncbi:MAG: RHS repeat-associated core domain-containing protein [Gammaproteobacteria bacterium]|nr:RHS repeat-associated core domain-containing protein [Gammaproteobacteria bacterium]
MFLSLVNNLNFQRLSTIVRKTSACQLSIVSFFALLVGTAHATISTTTYDYDIPNGTTTITDPNNKRAKYHYDAINQLTKIEYLDSPGVPTFDYFYDATNQLERITYPGGEQIYGYDDLDRLETIKDFGQTFPLLAFRYDHRDRITWITYPDGGEVCYEYDGDSRITRVGRVVAGTTASICDEAVEKTDYGYDNRGRLSTLRYPNGITTEITYDPTTGKTLSVGHSKASGALIYQDAYTYHLGTNLYETVTRYTSSGKSVTFYDYDAYERLKTVVEESGRKTEYEYDPFGNRTQERITNVRNPNAKGGSPKAYGDYVYEYVPNSNRLDRVLLNGVELERYSYDNAGRMSQRVHASEGTTTYTFDDRGLLTRVVTPADTIDYMYDALGQRKSKTVNGQTTLYVTANLFGYSQVLMELNSDLSIKSSYVYGGLNQLKEEPNPLDRNADLYLLHEGRIGNITHAVDMNGATQHEYRYDAFGLPTVVKNTGSSQQSYGYTGQQWDAESKLLYLRARYYDPAMGRFISADPFLGRLEEPVTQNRFIYVHNNPVMYTDPSGLLATWDHWQITYDSVIAFGYGETYARSLADAVVRVDEGTQTSRPEHTNIHGGMIGDNQNIGDALSAFANLIVDPQTPLEVKIHAIQDAAAPWHLGQEWDPISNPLDALWHLLRDAFPGAGVKDQAALGTKGLLETEFFYDGGMCSN